MNEEVKDCFKNARKDENKGKKHKGLLFIGKDDEKAKEYILKAKKNLELCIFLKEGSYDYKIPEEWFYTLYYCALAILSKFGIETRSQKCTAYFIRYVKNKGLIYFDDDFIDRITVYKDKEERSDVDERENSRYSTSIKIEEVSQKFDYMNDLCKKAISQAEDIVFSKNDYKIPDNLYI
jgi:uncharacterized protein (UPF0332 family)